MKILFAAQCELKRELGGAKVIIELAEAINKLGHEVHLVGPEEVKAFLIEEDIPASSIYAENLRLYLIHETQNYDAVDYDANYLPYPRSAFSNSTLFVARSVLFVPHLEQIIWPQSTKLKDRLIRCYQRLRGLNPLMNKVNSFRHSLEEADIINVSNEKDVEWLKNHGFSQDKIICLPYGIDQVRRKDFEKAAQKARNYNNIVFVGTFDYRKGCLDIPKIFKKVKQAVPDATLTLLGTKGLHQSAQQVFDFFPKALRSDLKIYLNYRSEELPKLLSSKCVGVFPSYLEGFGFAVVEMLAAGIPVFAYNAPGPSSILPHNQLTIPGDWEALSDKVIAFLLDKRTWGAKRIQATTLSKKYDWALIAKATITAYEKHIKCV